MCLIRGNFSGSHWFMFQRNRWLVCCLTFSIGESSDLGRHLAQGFWTRDCEAVWAVLWEKFDKTNRLYMERILKEKNISNWENSMVNDDTTSLTWKPTIGGGAQECSLDIAWIIGKDVSWIFKDLLECRLLDWIMIQKKGKLLEIWIRCVKYCISTKSLVLIIVFWLWKMVTFGEAGRRE